MVNVKTYLESQLTRLKVILYSFYINCLIVFSTFIVLKSGYTKPCYEPLRATMTHNDSLWPTMTQNIHTMTQNLVNYLPMTQNKILGLFIFLNFVPKIIFWVSLVRKLEIVLFMMKLNTKGYFRVLIPFWADLDQIWSQKFKVLCLEWKSVQSGIQKR